MVVMVDEKALLFFSGSIKKALDEAEKLYHLSLKQGGYAAVERERILSHLHATRHEISLFVNRARRKGKEGETVELIDAPKYWWRSRERRPQVTRRFLSKRLG
jgi:hypothetical protein